MSFHRQGPGAQRNSRQFARDGEQRRRQHGRASWGDFTDFPGGRGGRTGPPPWVAGLFGFTQGESGRGPRGPRGPRVRRGEVRSAILDVLRGGAHNGYQIITAIQERTDGVWRPSPGSVYPTLQQLEDEGLVAAGAEGGRRDFSLTEAGNTYVDEHPEELAAVWRPFEARESDDSQANPYAALKPEIGQVMSAVWQIATAGSDSQRRAAVDILIDTRRRLYGILADGEQPTNETDETA